MSLHDKILGMMCDRTSHIEYKKGHFDARHSAADLAIEYEQEIESLKEQLANAKEEIKKLKSGDYFVHY